MQIRAGRSCERGQPERAIATKGRNGLRIADRIVQEPRELKEGILSAGISHLSSDRCP